MLIMAEVSSRKHGNRLWISSLNLMAVIFNLKKQQASNIEFLRVEPTLILKLLKHVKAVMEFTVTEFVG